MRTLDPPQRKGWVRQMPPHKAATMLLKDYLESRLGCRGSDNKPTDEALACKSFLRAAGNAMSDGNPADIGLKAVQGAKWGTVSIMCFIHGVGSIAWLPTLEIPSSDRLKHIMREASHNRVAVAPPEREAKFDPFGEEPKRRIPPKVESRLIPGTRGSF